MLRHISSLQHPIVKHLIKLRQNRDYRYEHHRIVIEGLKPVVELAKDNEFHTIVVRDPSLVPPDVKTEEVVVVNESIMAKISGMYRSEGILAEMNMPWPASLTGCRAVLALDGVNDPGNVGTLMRTALALGWDGIFILEESCDPFNEKALRAARGATFRLPLSWGTWDHLQQLIYTNQLKPLVADLKGQSLHEFKGSPGLLLVMGNEAHGASQTAKNLCQAITIPMNGNMESLNVAIAGGILMYSLRQLSAR